MRAADAWSTLLLGNPPPETSLGRTTPPTPGSAGTVGSAGLSFAEVVAPGQGPPPLRVLEVLGQGGMGEVLLAEQAWLDREVAVKVAAEPAAAGALAAEALVAAAIDHPAVPPIHDAGRDFLVMKRIRGSDLSEAMRRGLPLHEVVACVAEAAAAAAWAHDQGLVHRDIKPANLMRDADGSVYLVDWGLAVSVGAAPGPAARFAPRLATWNTCGGTPSYAAPEQARGDHLAIGPATDVFLLAATIYRAVAGRPPWGGGAAFALASAAAGAVPAVPAECPSGLAAILERAMRRDPAERGSARDLRRDLLAWLGRQAGEAEALELLKREPPPPPPEDPCPGVRAAAELAERAAGLAGHLPEVQAGLSAARRRYAEACLAQGDLALAAAWAAGAGAETQASVAAARAARAAAVRREGWWRRLAWVAGVVAAITLIAIAARAVGAPGRELATRRAQAAELAATAAAVALPPAGSVELPGALARREALLTRAEGLDPDLPAVVAAWPALAAAAIEDALLRRRPADAGRWLARADAAVRQRADQAIHARAAELLTRQRRLAELRALAAWSQPWEFADPSKNPDTPEGRRHEDDRWGLRAAEAAAELAAWDGPELAGWLAPLLDGQLASERRLACAVLARRPDLDDGGRLAALAAHLDPAVAEAAAAAIAARAGQGGDPR